LRGDQLAAAFVETTTSPLLFAATSLVPSAEQTTVFTSNNGVVRDLQAEPTLVDKKIAPV
jgi:hypothetical protein